MKSLLIRRSIPLGCRTLSAAICNLTCAGIWGCPYVPSVHS